MTRLPYEPSSQGTNMIQGGFFKNTLWKPRIELQRSQSSMHSIWMHEMNYVNATGYWLALQQCAFVLMDQAAQVPTPADASVEHIEAGKKQVSLFGAWTRILGEYAHRVLAVRMEFYRNSVRDPVAARLNQEMIEDDTYLPVNDTLDERVSQMESLRERQLMKAFAAFSAGNAVKRAGKGEARLASSKWAGLCGGARNCGPHHGGHWGPLPSSLGRYCSE